MISKKSLAVAALIASACVSHAQYTFFEVGSTPYDRQMLRVQEALITPAPYRMNSVSFGLVNEWMIELRSMPYRYSREWRTPWEVQATRMGDCKAKAVALYDRMQLHGATNLRLVIGKRRATDSLTHAWLEWETAQGTVLLDPTFNWAPTMKTTDAHSYVAYYGYEGAHKYQAGTLLLTKRAISAPNPAAPAHGAITRPVRTASRTQPSRSSFNNDALESSFLFRRTIF
ncbi:MAG TPA: hypothetical protein VFA58_07715 [Chthoniobacterales bacterium]|nr:hypothetical protein [Chthoniobacterales bacterium]